MKNAFLVFLLIISISKSFSQVNLSAGLMAYYPFNGNANDASGNGNNAVYNNATLTSDRFGNANSAYSFNGIDNFIQILNSPSLNPIDQISICAWVEVSGFYQGPCHGNNIIMKGDGDYLPGNYMIRFDDSYYTNNQNCSIAIPDINHESFFGIGSAPYSNTPFIQTNQWYSVVYTSDGTTAKIYVNCQLVGSGPANGSTFSNNYDLFFGKLNNAQYPYWFNGVMDEVRIYNRPLNMDEVNAYGDCSANVVKASFDAPDTVCVNTPVQITNTSVGATSYYWNFCSANINASPLGANIGNPGGQLAGPVYIDYAEDSGNFHGFVSNNYSGTLTRLDFGNSLLNAPTATNLGTVGGVIPQNAEGIQVIHDQGNWYVFIVGGDPVGAGTPSKIVKIELGANIANNSPTGTDWGNIGNLLYPHDLYIFNDNGTWYGITANYSNSTITRFNFTSSFANTPTAVNLGNIGNLDRPTGLHAINDNGTWHVFVTNAISSTLSRLDFGGSLLSTPTGINLGNINNTFSTSWDIFVFKYCGEFVGFLINADQSRNDLVRLNFGGSITSTPAAVSLGNIGNCDFPHCLSKIFRVGPDLYSFIPNVATNSITRLQFAGCTNSSIPNSTAQNPPIITYNIPGIYNINLSVDDGLPAQSAYCKPIVVTSIDSMKIKDSLTSCTNVDFNGMGYTTMSGVTSWKWNFGDGTFDSVQNTAHTYSLPGTYPVKLIITNNGGCSDSLTTNVTITSFSITKSNDTAICASSSAQLFASGGTSYSWSPSATLNNPNIPNPVATPLSTTVYYVTVSNTPGCSKTDSVKITVNNIPVITKSNDTAICNQTSVQLFVTGGVAYLWSPAATLDSPTSATPVASPLTTTTYKVKITDNFSCNYFDSVKISILPAPLFTISPDGSVCSGASLQLTASGGDSYLWEPANGLNNPAISNPVATLEATTSYTVTIHENTCNQTGVLSTTVQVFALPEVKASSSNDLTCSEGSSQLNATGASTYMWSPATGLNNSNIPDPIATPGNTTLYTVTGEDINGCNNSDTVTVKTDFNMNALYLMANSFTPNGDGKNDCFGIKEWGIIQDLDFSIYNRFGERVFHTNDAATCWDGTYHQLMQDADVYVYVIKAKTACGNIEKKGTVIMIR